MLFDLRTLMVFIASAHLAFAILMLVYWQTRRQDRALAIWSASNLVGAAAWLLIALRDYIPNWSSIALGNAMLMLAWALLWAGMRSFSERRFSGWVIAAPALIVMVLFLFIPAVRDNLVARIVVVNVGLMSTLLAVGWDAHRDQRTEPLLARRIVVLALLGAVISNCTRALLSINLSSDASFLAPSWVQEVGVFAQGVAGVIWNVGLMLMARERLENALARAALRDHLTNVLNRAGFRELGDRHIALSTRDGSPLSVLMMDLDHFKVVNDRYGHAAGDRLLCAFVESARRIIRTEDLLARYGGEEFCVLLPNTRLAEAHRIAERIRADFETINISIGGNPVGTTVCIGVAEIQRSDETIERALSRADTGLYLAKSRGRNQVCQAPNDGPPQATALEASPSLMAN